MHDRPHRDQQGAAAPPASPDASRARGPAGPGSIPMTAVPSRRRFLFALGATSAAAIGGEAQAAAALAAPPATNPSHGGYRETDHVRRYYDSARN